MKGRSRRRGRGWGVLRRANSKHTLLGSSTNMSSNAAINDFNILYASSYCQKYTNNDGHAPIYGVAIVLYGGYDGHGECELYVYHWWGGHG